MIIRRDTMKIVELPRSEYPWTLRVWREWVIAANQEHAPIYIETHPNGELVIETLIPENEVNR